MAFRSVYTVLFAVFRLLGPTLSLTPEQYCFNGCNSVCYTLTFEGGGGICGNEHFLRTNFYCAAIYCSENEMNAAIDDYNKSCNDLLPSFESVMSSAVLGTISHISYEEALATANRPLNHAVIPDPQFYEIAFDTVVSL